MNNDRSRNSVTTGYLADRTNGRAYATMLRPSVGLLCLSVVCDVCIVG